MKERVTILDHNSFDYDDLDGLDLDISSSVKRRLNTIGPTTMLFYQKPLHIVRGEGVWLYDINGNEYLDVYNNVPSLGHCHPKVVDEIYGQLKKLNIHTRYLHETVHEYSEKLLAKLPSKIDRLIMTCTGTESNDLAMRLAKTHTGKQGFIVSESAYHGNSTAVTEISPSAYKSLSPPDYVVTVPVAAIGIEEDEVEKWFANNVKKALDTLNERGYGCAALILDSIFSSDGVYSDPKGFIKTAVEIVQKSGALFIADEVQPGFGRTGESFWGFERHGVIPDIVTMGKPMGNGYPVAGLASRVDLLEEFSQEVGYFNTFGGSTVAATAALAVLNVIEEENIVQNALEVGEYLKRSLSKMKGEFGDISDVRGVGLFLGLEFSFDGDIARPNPAMASHVMNALRRNNVLIGGAGKHSNTLKIRPPLCFSKDNADLFLDKLYDAINDSV